MVEYLFTWHFWSNSIEENKHTYSLNISKAFSLTFTYSFSYYYLSFWFICPSNKFRVTFIQKFIIHLWKILKARLFGGRHKAFTRFLSFISDHDNQFRFLLCQNDSQLCTLLFSLYIYQHISYKCYTELRLMSSASHQPIWLK